MRLIEIELEEVCRQAKDINRFRKDHMLVPITQNSYFSLCIIYNPSLILNTKACNNAEEGTCNNLLIPYILYFDSSSNYYISNNVAKNIRK